MRGLAGRRRLEGSKRWEDWQLLVGWMGVGVLALGVAVGISYWTVPRGNTEQTSFDAIIVLGSPADPDGKPSVEQRERVTEGVQELKRGHAEHLIVTGGAAHNRWIEGWTEAQLAERLGVPEDAVFVEGRSTNTVQNVFYAWGIMRAHGWTSAEVVSSHSHLPRTGLILERYEGLGLRWHTQASHWPREYPVTQIAGYYAKEAVGTALLRWFGYRRSPYVPGTGWTAPTDGVSGTAGAETAPGPQDGGRDAGLAVH